MNSLAHMHEALATGGTSSRALIEAALTSAELHRTHNIFISIDAEGALASADVADQAWKNGTARLLEGMPVAVKDNIAVANRPLSGGSRALGKETPRYDATTVAKLREAGAIVIGKTNLHEFALGVTSNNHAFGAVANPRAPERSAGGSSGGTAAAIAAGIVPAGLGTDTGGSGRIPAAFCGCVGFRPSTGRYSASGVMSLTWTLDTVSTFASQPQDIELLDRVLSGSVLPPTEPTAPDWLVLGVPKDSLAADLDPMVETAFAAALSRLEAAGVKLVPIDLAQIQALDQSAGFPIAMFEATLLWRRELMRRRIDAEAFLDRIASPDVRAIFGQVLNGAVSQDAYTAAMKDGLTPLRHAYAHCFAVHRIDAIVFPTVPVPPPPIGVDDEVMLRGDARPLFPTIVRNTSPGAMGGLPGISLPFGRMDDGLPFGLELDAPAGGDMQLLAIARTVASLAPQPGSER